VPFSAFTNQYSAFADFVNPPGDVFLPKMGDKSSCQAEHLPLFNSKPEQGGVREG
jgi:hypothetical protein